MRTDLHIHSNYSDSSRSPEEIAAIAKGRNVGLISVCDHATVEAYDRLHNACKTTNIQCILGVELGADIPFMHDNEGFTIGALDIPLEMLDLKGIV